jgi:peroxiredoxin
MRVSNAGFDRVCAPNVDLMFTFLHGKCVFWVGNVNMRENISLQNKGNLIFNAQIRKLTIENRLENVGFGEWLWRYGSKRRSC